MNAISVIIPTYNRSKFISEAIESVINQSYPDWELIVVDDFSTDNTEEIVTNFILRDDSSRIKYIKNERKKGVSGARNTGIKYSKEKYIAFLDSDDFWDKDNLKLKAEILNSNQSVDALISDCSFFGEVEKYCISEFYIKELFHDKFWVRKNMSLSIAQGPIILFMLKNGFPFRVQSLLLKKELLDKVGLFNENMIYYEDSDFILKCFYFGKVGYLDKKLCHIRRHSLNCGHIYGKGVIMDSDIMLIKEKYNYAIKCYPEFAKTVLTKELRNAYICRATEWFKEGHIEEAKKCILESIKINFCVKAFIRLCGIYIIFLLPKYLRIFLKSKVMKQQM